MISEVILLYTDYIVMRPNQKLRLHRKLADTTAITRNDQGTKICFSSRYVRHAYGTKSGHNLPRVIMGPVHKVRVKTPQ